MHIAPGTHYASHVFQFFKALPVRRVTSEELSTTAPEGPHKPAGAAVGNSGVNQTIVTPGSLPFSPTNCATEPIFFIISLCPNVGHVPPLLSAQ